MPKSQSSSRSSSSSSSTYRRRSSNRYRSRSRSLKSRHVKSTFHNFDNTKSTATVVKASLTEGKKSTPRTSTPAVTSRLGEYLRTVTRDANPEEPTSSLGEKFRGRTPLKLRYNETKEYKITIKQPITTKVRTSSRPVVLGLDNPDELFIKRGEGEGLRPIFARSEVVVNKQGDLPPSYRKRNSKSRSRSLDDDKFRSSSATRSYRDRVVRYEPKRSGYGDRRNHTVTSRDAYNSEASDKSNSDRYNHNTGKSKYSPERTVRYSPNRRGRSPESRSSRYPASRNRRHSSSSERHRRKTSRGRSRERSRDRERGRDRESSSSRPRHREKSSPKEKSGYYIDEQREQDRVRYEKARLKRLAVLSKNRHPKGQTDRRRSRSTSGTRTSVRPRNWQYDQRHMEGPYEGPFIPPHSFVPICDQYIYSPMGPVMVRPFTGQPPFIMRPRAPCPPFAHPFRHPPMNPMGFRPNFRPRFYAPGHNNHNNNQNKK